MTFFFAFLVAGAPLASPVGVAASSPSADYPQARELISTDDLDLTEAADRKRLDRRIAWAAAKICRDLSATGTLLEQSQCSSRAISNVRAKRAALVARAFCARTRELNGGGVASGFTGVPAADSAESDKASDINTLRLADECVDQVVRRNLIDALASDCREYDIT